MKDLSPDQARAIVAVRKWWRLSGGVRDCQVFSLAGFAGTGKTTVISRLLAAWDGPVIVGAPTGKAAHALRQKGVRAETIHRLAYRMVGYDAEGNPEFTYEGLPRDEALVVIDEASMVNQRTYDDLRSGGYRILFVGDHGQLAPVGGDPQVMRYPDFVLTQIHRQDDAGLLAFAHALREGEHVPVRRGAARTMWIPPTGEDEEVLRVLEDADNVICWRNSTRHWLNHVILKRTGWISRDIRYRPRELRTPELTAIRERCVGESWESGPNACGVPVVCLRNDYRRGVFNGQCFGLCVTAVKGDRVFGVLVDECGEARDEAAFDLLGFGLDRRGYQPADGTLLFDFGCCLTAHKSQGSAWPHVVVYDDTYSNMEDRPRWAYTAATRAEKKLTWLHR